MTGTIPWRTDPGLRPLAEVVPSLGLLSVDVFDTLLLRRCGSPSEVYLHAGRLAAHRGLLGEGVTPDVFRAARVRAEARARRRLAQSGSTRREVALRAIYAELPGRFGNPDALAECELAAERGLVYLNPVLDDLLRELDARQVPVVLVSNTYFSGRELRELLGSAGLDPDRVAAVFSSADQGVRKQDGLYPALRAAYPRIAPERMCHLGDDREADLFAAEAAGIPAIWYRPAAEVGDLLEWESVCHEDAAAAIRPLRRLAGHLVEDRVAEPRQAFLLGALVLGPVLARFADWVVASCLRQGIRQVWGILREGGVLADLVAAAARRRGVSLRVLPLHLSRQSTLCAAVERLDDPTLEAVASRRSYTLGEFLALFGVKEPPAPWRDQADTPLDALRHPPVGKGTESPWAALKASLADGPLRLPAERHLTGQRELLGDYLAARRLPGEPVATLDLGWSGTIQSAIDALARGSDWTPVHFLLFGSDRILDWMERGGEVRCCFGNLLGGDGAPMIGELLRSAAVLEQLLSGTEASTLGYARQDGGVVPVLGGTVSCRRDRGLREHLALGVRRFQQLWLATGAADLGEHGLPGTQLLRLLHRFIDLPTPAEAVWVGAMRVELNNGTDATVAACPPRAVALVRRLGPERVLESEQHRLGYEGMLWPKGCITLAFPDYLLRARVRGGCRSGYLAAMLGLARRVGIKKYRRLAIYGAGQVGSAFITAARLTGLEIAAVLDRNERLWGTRLLGVPVMSLREALRDGTDCVVICSFAFGEAIAAAVQQGAREAGREVALIRPDSG